MSGRGEARLDAGEGLMLVPVQVSDAEELFCLVERNRLYLRQWLPWLDVTRTVEDQRAFLEAECASRGRGKDGLYVLRQDGEALGVIGVVRTDVINRSRSIGYWLSEEHQRNGYMTRACRHLVDWLFDGEAVNRVEIRAAVGNGKSASIPRRLGFTREGRLRESEFLYDHYVDQEVWSVLHAEWKSGPLE